MAMRLTTIIPWHQEIPGSTPGAVKIILFLFSLSFFVARSNGHFEPSLFALKGSLLAKNPLTAKDEEPAVVCKACLPLPPHILAASLALGRDRLLVWSAWTM